MSANSGSTPVRMPIMNNRIFSDALQSQRENIMPNGNTPFQSNPRAEGTARDSNLRGNVRRLRVEDALCYLDQVKQQFADAPDVYVNFLDVMKDFKSQAIDTPGVIKRVSRLFRGRPNLIIGFNTFLPPGFDVCVDGQRIIISEPNGRRQVIDEGRSEPSGPGPSQEMQRPQAAQVPPAAAQISSAVSLVPPATASAAALPPGTSAPALAVAETRVVSSQLVPSAQQVVTEQSDSEAAPAVVDQSSGEVGPAACITSRSVGVKYQDAVTYINKVMVRFEKRPEVRYQFLDILHQLQRMKDTQEEGLDQGYQQALDAIEVLFENDADLVQEFKQQFYSKPVSSLRLSSVRQDAPSDSAGKMKAQKSGDRSALVVSPQPVCVPKVQVSSGSCPGKRAAPAQLTTTVKRAKLGSINVLTYDTDVEEAAKYGTVEDYLFFDKVRRALDDNSHKNFLRCLALYNHSIVSRHELVELLTPLIGRFTTLMKYMKDLLGLPDTHTDCQQSEEKQRRQQAPENDNAEMEHRIDYATCRRLGVSYRSLPDSYVKPLCSGRTPLCDSVLNDSWVSFPCWSSEDSSCVHSKKTQFEEFIFRTEDERYELDIVIEVNKAAMEVLEIVQRKMSRMKKEDLSKFHLDPALGGTSPSIMLRALRRIYGDHTQKMLDGAMKNPQIMVPRLIERMRQKDVEWRKMQELCNRIWREETEKHYAKSLDHQALSFKQNDLKMLRAKMIVSQFENLYDEDLQRAERNEETDSAEYGPHCIYSYPEDVNVLYDVNDLVIHYVKRQANIQKEEKRHAKRYLKRFIPELFNIPPQELSDEEDAPKNRETAEKSGTPEGDVHMSGSSSEEAPKRTSDENPGTGSSTSSTAADPTKSCTYRLFYGANAWCVFIKLHHLMCDRLAYLKKKHREIVANHEVEERLRLERERIINRCADNTESLKAVEIDTKLGLALLKSGSENPANYYSALISEIKNLLDGLIDNVAFEENVRKMFGTDAYLTFTIDKIIITIARQLQNMACEELNIASMELYKKYRFERPICLYSTDRNEEIIEEAYERAAQEMLTNQNCFKTCIIHEPRSVSMELIDSVITDDGEKGEGDQEWSRYVHHYVESLAGEPSSSTLNLEDQQLVLETIGERPPLFLMKHIKAGMEKYRKKEEETGKKTGDGNNESKPEEKWPDVTVNEDLYIQFSPAGNYKMRFAKGSSDLLVRAGAPRRGLDKHQAVSARRKERFLSWLEERLFEDVGDGLAPRNWLADGSRIVPVRHPEFPYLTYNRYLPGKASS